MAVNHKAALPGQLVYLAGPMSGLPFEECRKWRDKACAFLNELRDSRSGEHLYHVLNPLRGHVGIVDCTPCYDDASAERADIRRDRYDVSRADIVLADFTDTMKLEQPRASIGTVCELDQAHNAGKFIIIVMKEGIEPVVEESSRSWLAALLDGEGNIHVGVTTPESRLGTQWKIKNPSYWVRIHISMKSKVMVEKAWEVVGKRGTLRPIKSRDKWKWTVSGQEASLILTDLYPHLIIKKEKAAFAIETIRLNQLSSNAPNKGQHGFQSKSLEALKLQTAAYEGAKTAQKEQNTEHFTKGPPPGEPSGGSNPHWHSFIKDMAAVIFPTLDQALEYMKAVLNIATVEE